MHQFSSFFYQLAPDFSFFRLRLPFFSGSRKAGAGDAVSGRELRAKWAASKSTLDGAAPTFYPRHATNGRERSKMLNASFPRQLTSMSPPTLVLSHSHSQTIAPAQSRRLLLLLA